MYINFIYVYTTLYIYTKFVYKCIKKGIEKYIYEHKLCIRVYILCIYVCKYTKFVYVYKVSIYTNIKLYKELKQKNQNNLKKT